MNLSNYHSHCSYCDGKAPMEEFVVSAIYKGFTAYGISSHAPLPFSTPWSLKKEDVASYLSDITALKEKYKGKIELYAGMEIDYLSNESNPSVDFFQQLPLDYRIGSVHLLHAPNGDVVDIDTSEEKFKQTLNLYFNNDLKLVVEKYFTALMLMVNTGGFDIVGHFDKIYLNALSVDKDLLDCKWYQEKIDEFLHQVVEKGLFLEINTKAFIKKGTLFPNEKHWLKIKELQIPIVINSDAHFPEKVNEGRMEAIALLKEHGFTHAMQLLNNQWQNLPL
ncbi:MAG: histidinol-phosphatase [Marinifilaceae bacterium]